MNEQSTDSEAQPADRTILLSPVEARVLGVLMEKQWTTPDYYPMTVKGLVQACNQKTSRNPVMHLSEGEVGHTVNLLRDRKLVLAGFSGRAERYEQRLSKLIGLDRQAQALLCALMLRGPQTLGELRSNAARMAVFDDLAAVQLALDDLAARQPPLVEELPRAAGRREERYRHLLCGDTGPQAPADAKASSDNDLLIASLQQDVSQLRVELDALWRMTGLQKPSSDEGSG